MTNIKRAISLVWQSSPNWMIANVIFNVIQSILPLTLLYIIKLIVDRIAVSISINDKQQIFGDITFLLINAGAIVLWINFNFVGGFNTDNVYSLLAIKISLQMAASSN